jgi:hypothetical protein
VSSRIVLQCGNSVQELAMSNKVRLVFVPGHYGIHENQEVDAFARARSNSALVGPEPCLPLAPSSVKWCEREWVLNSH